MSENVTCVNSTLENAGTHTYVLDGQLWKRRQLWKRQAVVKKTAVMENTSTKQLKLLF